MSDHTGPAGTAPESVEELFAAHEVPLLRYALKLVKNVDTAQEIVQEAFMRLHTQFNAVQQPRPWLYRTAHNLAINHLRAGQKIVPIDFDTPPPDSSVQNEPPASPDAHIQRLEAIEQTRACLQTLNDRERELIRLKFDEGLSYKEISQRTGLTVSNVGYILHHALKHLATALENMGVNL